MPQHCCTCHLPVVPRPKPANHRLRLVLLCPGHGALPFPSRPRSFSSSPPSEHPSIFDVLPTTPLSTSPRALLLSTIRLEGHSFIAGLSKPRLDQHRDRSLDRLSSQAESSRRSISRSHEPDISRHRNTAPITSRVKGECFFRSCVLWAAVVSGSRLHRTALAVHRRSSNASSHLQLSPLMRCVGHPPTTAFYERGASAIGTRQCIAFGFHDRGPSTERNGRCCIRATGQSLCLRAHLPS